MRDFTKRVRVADVLELVREPVNIDPLHVYTSVGVRSFGKGLFHYESQDGSQLSKLRWYKLRPGELVVSNIKAWEGAIAMSSQQEVGCIASNRFLTYRPKDDRVHLGYLRHFFLSEAGLLLLGRASPGSADRNRTLAIDRFENLEIPLPDIEEQRRAASFLDRANDLASRVGALVDGRADLRSLIPRLLDGLLEDDCEEMKIEEMATFVTDMMHASKADHEGLDFVGLEHIEPHTGRVLGSSSPGLASGPKKVFAPGDVLYPRLRPYQNKVWLADRRGVCSSDQLVLRPTLPENAAAFAVVLRCQHVLDQAVEMTSNLQLPRIRQIDFGQLTFRMPSDPRRFVSASQRITEKMHGVVKAVQYQRELAAAYFPAALNSVFAKLR